MVKKVDTVLVKLWGKLVGAAAWLDDRGYAVFEFDPNFLKHNIDIAPIQMNLDAARNSNGLFSFPALNRQTYLGLPGLLADALPDKFGNAIIDAWLARNGRDSSEFSPIERLCYTGPRAMGALEFEPAIRNQFDECTPVEIDQLVRLTQDIMQSRKDLQVELGANNESNADAILDILRVGTSAGGARPKAVIAMNEDGNVLSGQMLAPKGYDYWLLKFDGVTDLELGEPGGFGRIEYAYYLMAKAAGINMTECRLFEENGRAHFLTKRFDRVNNDKYHMQTLCGLAHYDFNMAGAYGYEQAFSIMRKVRLTKADAAEQFRRMVFNVLARNLDDHTKNISFLMNKVGQWKLSPAYDVTYAHNPAGQWTNQHQMSINGKREKITRNDLLVVAKSINLNKADDIIHEVSSAIERWDDFAESAGVGSNMRNEIKQNHLKV